MPHAIGFVSLLKLREHFQDHGPEFNAVDEWDYLQRAIAFLETPLGTNATEECQRRHRQQDTVRFNPVTDEFAVVHPNGVIRTYFKPVPARLAPPGTTGSRIHHFATNREYFEEACRQ